MKRMSSRDSNGSMLKLSTNNLLYKPPPIVVMSLEQANGDVKKVFLDILEQCESRHQNQDIETAHDGRKNGGRSTSNNSRNGFKYVTTRSLETIIVPVRYFAESGTLSLKGSVSQKEP